MGGWADTRGVSEVLGAILVFSVLVALLALFQITIVPSQNEKIEFKHNEKVQGQMQDVRTAIHTTAVTGSSQSATVDLAPQYPSRILLLNPSAGSGTIRAETDRPMIIGNTTALDGETADYLNGGPKSFDSGGLGFRPAYNYYDNAPVTVYENSVAYNMFESGEVITLTDQQLINGRRITLTTVDGNRSVSKTGETTLDIKAVSPATTTVAVKNDTSGNITLTIPTQLSATQWEDILNEELEPNGGHVVNVSNHPTRSAVRIELEPNITYNLQMARVGVGSNIDQTSAHYLTEIEGDGVSVAEDGRQKLVVQVRDKFNNPVSGATINFSIDGTDPGELIGDGQVGRTLTDIPTGEDGKVEVFYEAPTTTTTSPRGIEVDASFKSDPSAVTIDPAGKENVTFDLRVINASKINRTQPLFNPAKGVVLKNATIASKGSEIGTCSGLTGANSCEVNITFKNTKASGANIEKLRYVFYSADLQGFSGTDSQAFLDVVKPAPTKRFPIGDEFETVPSPPLTVNGGSTETIVVDFYESSSTAHSVKESEFFVISLIIDGVRETYFISPS